MGMIWFKDTGEIVLLVIMRAIYIYSLYLTIILRSEITILPLFTEIVKNNCFSLYEVIILSTTIEESFSKFTLGREFKPAILFSLDHTHYSLLGD